MLKSLIWWEGAGAGPRPRPDTPDGKGLGEDTAYNPGTRLSQSLAVPWDLFRNLAWMLLYSELNININSSISRAPSLSKALH